MNDRYLFKAIDCNSIWRSGLLIALKNNRCAIEENDESKWACDTKTLCQCTGLKDKSGKLIWENDIVRTVYDGIEHIYQVIWDESELNFKATNGKENYESNFEYLTCCDEIEVIGNKFDNPELLKECDDD